MFAACRELNSASCASANLLFVQSDNVGISISASAGSLDGPSVRFRRALPGRILGVTFLLATAIRFLVFVRILLAPLSDTFTCSFRILGTAFACLFSTCDALLLGIPGLVFALRLGTLFGIIINPLLPILANLVNVGSSVLTILLSNFFCSYAFMGLTILATPGVGLFAILSLISLPLISIFLWILCAPLAEPLAIFFWILRFALFVSLGLLCAVLLRVLLAPFPDSFDRFPAFVFRRQ